MEPKLRWLHSGKYLRTISYKFAHQLGLNQRLMESFWLQFDIDHNFNPEGIYSKFEILDVLKANMIRSGIQPPLLAEIFLELILKCDVALVEKPILRLKIKHCVS